MADIARFELFEQLRKHAFNFQRGIERETLRVDQGGQLSQKMHPEGLGSALTHDAITTDYSEALLEFITGVHTDKQSLLSELEELHCFTFSQLDKELLWSNSMPSPLPAQEDIPIAQYGDSHIGRLKTIYRHGLWHRYGRKMQTIAGLHYNWSLPDEFWRQWALLNGKTGDLTKFKTDEYFGLIRSFRKHSWLLLYLFGASPAADKSFLDAPAESLAALSEDTLYAPYATSLRMSDVGYSNQAQAELFVCFNSLDSYAKTLSDAIVQPYPEYEAIGIQDAQGEYKQLSASILQIENEYYSDIRPKRVSYPGEKQIHAIRKRGVEYIEVRCLDVNPYLPLGIDETQIDFMDLFLLWCLIQDHPEISYDECRQMQNNTEQVAMHGRDPSLRLTFKDQDFGVTELAEELLDSIERFAEKIDSVKATTDYVEACRQQRQKVRNPALTPSSLVMNDVQKHQSYSAFGLAQSRQLIDFYQHPLSAERAKVRLKDSQRSWQRQHDIEASDQGTFEKYLENYLKQ